MGVLLGGVWGEEVVRSGSSKADSEQDFLRCGEYIIFVVWFVSLFLVSANQFVAVVCVSDDGLKWTAQDLRVTYMSYSNCESEIWTTVF